MYFPQKNLDFCFNSQCRLCVYLAVAFATHFAVLPCFYTISPLHRQFTERNKDLPLVSHYFHFVACLLHLDEP